jgi:hypothetical protein
MKAYSSHSRCRLRPLHSVYRSLRSEFAVPVGSGDSAVHEEIAAGDESAVRPQEESADRPHLIRGARPPGRRLTHYESTPLASSY